MKLGLIGHPLGHSISPEIHQFLIHEEYQKWDIDEEELSSFMQRKDFDGINVTIPYKKQMFPYLDELDEAAKEIGAVNCVINHHGKCIGYNTDWLGFQQMLIENNIDVKAKKTALLGTGGASKAVNYALQQLGANVQLVSRTPKVGVITYPELLQQEKEFQCIVNVTPVGMSPNINDSVIDINGFTNVDTVIDIIANPLRTKLMFDAKCKGIKTIGGFEMLVRQAFAADELFLNQKLDSSLNQACVKELLRQQRNIVLIGMPTSGKSTLAEYLAKSDHREVVEMDDRIVNEIGMSIKEYFTQYGETSFRQVEQRVAENLINEKGKIISCGGGVVTNPKTMQALSSNGIVIWIQRDLRYLFASDSRPLTGNEEYMQKLYRDRKSLYEKYSDVVIDNNGSLEEAARKIQEAAGEE